MSVPFESWAVGGSLWEQWPPQKQPLRSGSQRTNKQRHHCRKAMTCPRRVSQKPWEEITISLPPSMPCTSGGHWYNLISFQNHSCKGFWFVFFLLFFFFFFTISNLCRWKGYERGDENTYLRTHCIWVCVFCIPPFQVVSVCFSASPKQELLLPSQRRLPPYIRQHPFPIILLSCSRTFIALIIHGVCVLVIQPCSTLQPHGL